MLTVLAVIARIVTNPLSNVFQKQLARRSAEPLFIIAATHGLLTVVALPFLLARPLGGLGVVFWENMLTAVALAVAGNVMLVYALRSTDLSVLGPINAYKAVLSLALAVVLIGEVPTLFGLAGVMLIVVGSYFVIDREPGQGRSNAFLQFIREPGVKLRFAALLCSATEAVFLKRALLLSSPITTFLMWAVYFQERNIRRRLLGSLVMVIGAMLIVTLGRAPDLVHGSLATISAPSITQLHSLAP